ncbi:MAG: hypothetical protein V4760_02375, partial [Bdellovibrionota bacterium]
LVLIWNTMPSVDGIPADYVVGQTNFTGFGAGTTAILINAPGGLTVIGSKLWVADSLSNRLVRWELTGLANGQAHDLILGQPAPTVREANLPYGILATNFNNTNGLSAGSGRLLVADLGNHRVLGWNSVPTNSATPPDFVLGQSSFTSAAIAATQSGMNAPTGVFSNGTKVFVSDAVFNRVTIWSSFPASNATNADIVLGQTNFTGSSFATTATGLRAPQDVVSDGTRLIVSDTGNNRILIWNSIPNANGTAADVVLGQPLMTSGVLNNGGVSASSLGSPYKIAVWNGKLLVADRTNSRILIWNSIPTSDATPADVVVGQPNFVSGSYNAGQAAPNAFGFKTAAAIAVDAKGRLIVADTQNNRLMIWKSIPTTNFVPADVVIGQPSMTSLEGSMIGPTASTVALPAALSVDGTNLWVSDNRYYRVLRIPLGN